MLGPMTTQLRHIVPTLARTSWTLPWLTTLAISAALVWAMTAFLVGGQSYTFPPESAPTSTSETLAIGRACDPDDNWPLVYARTTGRIPANYCPAR